MTDQFPTNAEMAQLVAMLEDCRIVEVYLNDEGQGTYRITEAGVRFGHILAMVEGEDGEALMEALLADEAWNGASPVRSTARTQSGSSLVSRRHRRRPCWVRRTAVLGRPSVVIRREPPTRWR
jgi:hypothetical protein